MTSRACISLFAKEEANLHRKVNDINQLGKMTYIARYGLSFSYQIRLFDVHVVNNKYRPKPW